MKKIQTVLCCLLLLFCVTAAACGGQDTAGTADADVKISALQEAMLGADTTLPEMVTISSEQEQAELNFSYLSDLSYDLVDSYFYAYAKDGTAEELAVIRLKDKGDAAAMMESLHAHIKQRQGTFREYAPDQIEMTEQAVVTRQGHYVTLIISNKNGLVQKAFQSCFEK